NDLTIGSLSFFCKPVDKRRRKQNLIACIGDGLALFNRKNSGQLVLMSDYQAGPLTQNDLSLLCRFRTSGWQCPLCGDNGSVCILGVHVRNESDYLPVIYI